MENLDLNYLCSIISNLCGIPIRLYKDSKLIFFHSLVHLPKDPISLYLNDIQNLPNKVGYFVTGDFSYYGIVHSGNFRIIIGPSRQTANTEQELKDLAFRLDLLPEDIPDFLSGMKSIVRMPLESIMQILCTMNYVLNGQKLTLRDITIYDSEQDIFSKASTATPYSEENAHEQNVHNTYNLEQTIMSIVQKGDTAALKEWTAQAPAVSGGILAADQLRQIKNTFIVSATLASRAAIRGGMDVDDAFSLSDAYIQKCELLNTHRKIINLQFHMIREFTQRVERVRLGKHPSKLVIDVANYIRHHLSEPITAEEIARELYLSRPYLSRKFKEDSGESITDFVHKEKAEEAKRLLRYSDKSLTAISNYLGFSSQGHFSRVFKKCTSYTPGEYREKYAR